jgi:hypothetical protein
VEWLVADFDECTFDDLLADPTEFAVGCVIASLTEDLAVFLDVWNAG